MIFVNKALFIFFSYLLLISSLFAQSTDSWRLIWDKNKEADMSHYEVYRSIGSPNASARFGPDINHHDPAHFLDDLTMFIIDDDLEKGELIYYRLKAVDSSGLSSNFSDEVSACIPEILVPDILYFTPNSQISIDLDTLVNDKDNPINEFIWQVTGDIITFNSTGNILTFNIPSDTGEVDVITIQVTDTSEFYDQKEVTIYSSTATNFPPIINDIPNQTILRGESFSNISLDEYVYDPDDSDDDLTWTYSATDNLNITINQNRVAIITVLDEEWIGNEVVWFTVTDPTDLSASEMVVFTVNSDTVNQNEVLAFPIPLRPSRGGATDITFTNLPIGGKLIIYDLLGYPVYETDITSTVQPWTTLNQHGKWVRSGVYLYVVKNEKGKKVKSDKVIIIR